MLAVFLTGVAFWVGNLPHTTAASPTGSPRDNVFDAVAPNPGNLTAGTAHTLFAVLIVAGGALGVTALWMSVFGRVVNVYRADWYRAGLTDTERANQEALRKGPGTMVGAA